MQNMKVDVKVKKLVSFNLDLNQLLSLVEAVFSLSNQYDIEQLAVHFPQTGSICVMFDPLE